MSKFAVIIFLNENMAYEGTRALKELHAEGSIVLFSEAVIAKDGAGVISVKDAASDGPLSDARSQVGRGMGPDKRRIELRDRDQGLILGRRSS